MRADCSMRPPHWIPVGVYASRINRLINEVRRDPHEGIGKPEALKYGLAGAWSRRITDEHRLVYRIGEQSVEILQARYHY
ncbi:MAG: Txe/YoeB family addiction module toxin [Mycobacterium sp.]|nr:Txe/YoeB family addiction module toxin [Mycobacterium sp.]